MHTRNLSRARTLGRVFLIAAAVATVFPNALVAEATNTNLPAWVTRPLSLADALNLALQQNADVLKAKNDLEASHGVVVQTRAIALPKVQTTTTRGPSSF